MTVSDFQTMTQSGSVGNACGSCCACGSSAVRGLRLDNRPQPALLPGTIPVSDAMAALGIMTGRGGAESLPSTITGDLEEYSLNADAAVPLLADLSHHEVSDRHLWIGIEDGLIVVLDHDEHRLMMAFREGKTPIEVVAREVAERGVSEAKAWEVLSTLLEAIAAAGFIRGIAGHHEVRKAEPHRFSRLHLTKLCQLECIHCYAESSPHVNTRHQLPVDRWMQLIDDIADCGGERVLFTGGEALVYRGCIDLMRHAKKRGLHVTLFSNGILIPRYIDELVECVDAVQISIDSPHEEMNDRIRGKGSFRKAVDAVLRLLEHGIQVRIGMTVMEMNWESIKSGFLEFSKIFDGTAVEYRLGYGLAHHGRGEDLEDHLSVEETRPIVDRILRHVRPKDEPHVTRKNTGCGYAEQLVVAPDGTVYPCHLLDGALCHIDDAPLSTILSALTGVARDYDVNHSLGCNVCDIRNLCGGTCRVNNGKLQGSRLITSCTQPDKDERYRSLVRQYARS